MNSVDYFRLLSVISHHIIEVYGGNDIAQFERACGNAVQLIQLRSEISGNTVLDLAYKLSSAQWILSRRIYPIKVIIDKRWDECDMAIFSEVVANVRDIELHGASLSLKQLLHL